MSASVITTFGETRDMAVQAILVVTLIVLGFTSGTLLYPVLGISIAVLDIHEVLLWSMLVCGAVVAVLCLLAGALVLVPLQYLPPARTRTKRYHQFRLLTVGILFALVMWNHLGPLWTNGPRSVWALLFFVIGVLFSAVATKLRDVISRQIIETLILPALRVPRMDLPVGNNRYIKGANAVRQIRQSVFGATVQGGWQNITVTKEKFAIDAAYFVPQSQAYVAAGERRWVMWYLGNGELYEFLLQEMEGFTNKTGLCSFAFNYRGVSFSKGVPRTASTFVEDGVSCLEYLCGTLNARPEHVLLLGHSIGGAVASLVRAHHSPHGPLIAERTFSSLPVAGRHIMSKICHSVIGYKLSFPIFILRGLLASVFKGDMDVVQAWKTITGPRLCIYHCDDEIIGYKDSSLHIKLTQKHLINEAEEGMKLSVLPKRDHHNAPLSSFPEYERVVTACRMMVGFTTATSQLTSQHSSPVKPSSATSV